MISQSITPTQLALHEARKSRQAHMARMASRVRSKDNEPVRIVHDPLWIRQVVRFDAHVTAYHIHIAKYASPKRAFLIDRAKAKGYTITEITAPTRDRKVVIDRQDLMLEVAEEFPKMTLNELGRLFGGYDHSTVHYALDKAAMRRAGIVEEGEKDQQEPQIDRIQRPASNRTPDHVREQIVAIYRAGGVTQAELAKQFGLAVRTVRNIIIESGVSP